MNLVLDTNVIIAAFAARGLCADIFELCLADHRLFISSHILREVEDKLVRKLRLPVSRAVEIRLYLEAVATLVTPVDLSPELCRDPDDLPVIGTALAAQVTILVTGDNDLLSLGAVQGVRMLTPRQFWEILQH
jgi:putative PIN family toxin of toxin-antitoxin system